MNRHFTTFKFCCFKSERSFGNTRDGPAMGALFFPLLVLSELIFLRRIFYAYPSVPPKPMIPELGTFDDERGSDGVGFRSGGFLKVYSAALRALCCSTTERFFGEVRDGVVFLLLGALPLGASIGSSAPCSASGSVQNVVLILW